MITKNTRPIGIFDSGIGGLTIVKQINRLLPKEDIVYLGDTARFPYGTKSKDTIIKFSIQNVLYLLKFNVKLIIVACNTSSSLALEALRRNFKVPILGVIEPGVKEAVRITTDGRIGVIGTTATIRSKAYQDRIKAVKSSFKVFSQSCPLLVPLVEEGWLNGKITEQIIKSYLEPLKKNKIDTLILGCTHYPLLKSSIKRIMGFDVKLVDSAKQVALAAKEMLANEGFSKNGGRLKFYLTDEPERFKKVARIFMGKSLANVYKVKDEI